VLFGVGGYQGVLEAGGVVSGASDGGGWS